MKLATVLDQSLEKAGVCRAVTFGGEATEPTFTSQDKQTLIRQLEAVRNTSTKFAIVAGAAHILVFVTAIVLAWHYRDDANVVLTMIGGSAIALLVIATNLVGLWREKVVSDMLICTLPSLSPLEALKVIQSVFERLQRK